MIHQTKYGIHNMTLKARHARYSMQNKHSKPTVLTENVYLLLSIHLPLVLTGIFVMHHFKAAEADTLQSRRFVRRLVRNEY